MSYPVYYVPAGDVLPIFFDTFDGGTGASVTMTGLAATDIEIYKDGSATTRSSDAGYTLLDTDGIDFASKTGIHGFSIDTGDNTDTGFYSVGSWFHVVVSSVTVDAQTVSFIAAAFRIMAAEAIAGKPKADVDAWLGTAAATPTVAGVPEVDVTHIAGSTTDVSTIPASVAAILVDTGTTLDGKINTIDGIVDDILVDTGTTLPGTLSTIADYLDTEIAAIKAKTDNLPSDPADASDIASLIDALPTAAENAAALMDLADGIETSITPRQAIRLILAASAGKLSGAATTTVTIRNVGDSKDRITATVDADGNRSAVTTDAT